MFVSGMTIAKNLVRLDYPFIEAIRSALPLCDEFVAVIGDSDDGTFEAVQQLNDPKIRIVRTTWSEKVTPRKCILAQQTNIGLHLCRGDWVIYLQGNEVLHESSLPALRETMEAHKDNPEVEALLLERLTFWGDYDHVVHAYPERFKYSARILKPYVGMYSVRDAMSFAVFDGYSLNGRYPRAVDTGQDLFRYGFVQSPALLSEKYKLAVHIDGGDPNVGEENYYNYMPRQFVRRFEGTHPALMHDRVKACRFAIVDDDPRWRTKLTLKERQRLMETAFYRQFGLPHWRNTRYKLTGGYRPKPRN